MNREEALSFERCEIMFTYEKVLDLKRGDMIKRHRITREPNPFLEGTVVKSTVLRGWVGVDYDTVINTQRELEGKEGDYKAEPLPWGWWVKYPVLIEHRERLYIRVSYPEVVKSPTYHFDGKLIEEDISGYLRKPQKYGDIINVKLEGVKNWEIVTPF